MLNINFTSALKLILIAVLVAILSQNLSDLMSSSWISTIGVIFISTAFLYLYRKSFINVIDTPYFAISGLLGIALATVLGTIISQNAAPEIFVQRYGDTGSQVLRFFQMDDVFHSWWYVTLFILLTLSLIKISLRKEFSLANLGFHLAHLGPVIILLGFWLDYYAGFRGLIQLQTGNKTDHVWVYQRNTNRVIDSFKLKFDLQLDHFESEKFEPDHRIQIWENIINPAQTSNNEANSTENSARALTTLPLDLTKSWKIYNSDISFELKEFYPNFFLEYSYPDNLDTIEAKAPGILIEITTPHGSDLVQLLANVEGKFRLDEPILGVAFEFFWELPQIVSKELDNFNSESAWAQKNRIVIAHQRGLIYEIFNGEVSNRVIETNQVFPIPGKLSSSYSLLQIYRDMAYLSSQPATRDENQENPVGRLEVNRDSWTEPQEGFVYPSTSGQGGQYFIKGTNYFLALESIKDKETKYWESGLSIVDDSGSVLKQKSIKVNEPMTYKGYRFFQTDYDPNNPNYSGIGVSYMPGLFIIYFGFYVLVAGVLIMFYIRTLKANPLEVKSSL